MSADNTVSIRGADPADGEGEGDELGQFSYASPVGRDQQSPLPLARSGAATLPLSELDP